MATALTAQGIGFSGAPREYTGIVMQRNRQKQLDEQAAKEKQDKEYDKLYEKINIKDPTKFFSFDLQDIKRTTAETIDRLAKAKASGNYSEAQKIVSDYNTTIGSLQQQKIDYDANVKTGKNIYDPELINFENSPSRAEAAKKYAGREGVVSENNQFRFKATPNYDDQKLFTDIAKDPNVIMEDTPETTKDQFGNMLRVNRFKINKTNFDARLANAIQDPQIFAAEAAKYRIKNPDWRKLPDLDFQQNVIDDFMNRGRSFAGIPRGRESKFGKGITITNNNINNNGSGDSNLDPTQRAGDVTIDIKTTDLNGNLVSAGYTLKDGIQTGDLNATAVVPNTARNLKTGKKFESIGGVKYTANSTGVGAFAKKDIYFPPKQNADGSLFPGKLIKQGEIIADYLLENFPNEVSKDRLEYKATTFAVTDKGEPIAFEAKLPTQDMYLKSDNKDKPIIKYLIDLSERVKFYNGELPSSPTNSREAKPPTKAPASAPKPAPKPAVKKDESRDIPSSGTRTKEERIKANPKLNNSPK
jgi:hypothetical protein